MFETSGKKGLYYQWVESSRFCKTTQPRHGSERADQERGGAGGDRGSGDDRGRGSGNDRGRGSGDDRGRGSGAAGDLDGHLAIGSGEGDL